MSSISGKLVEGVFRRVLAADLTPALITQLADAGVDLSLPVEAEYPRATWYRAVELTATALFPKETPALQLRRLGVHIMGSLQERQIIKGPWLAMARLVGPRRGLRQAAELTDRSPVKLTITDRSKSEVEITADDTAQPDFLAGLIEGAVGMLGGKSPEVGFEGLRGELGVFRASWR